MPSIKVDCSLCKFGNKNDNSFVKIWQWKVYLSPSSYQNCHMVVAAVRGLINES